MPRSAMKGAIKDGAGFAGFAASFDLSPADGDMIAGKCTASHVLRVESKPRPAQPPPCPAVPHKHALQCLSRPGPLN